MDRALDDIIGERQSSKRGGPSRRRNDQGRGNSYRKNDNESSRHMDSDWLHDKYDDEDGYSQPTSRFSRDRRPRDRSPEDDLFNRSVKLRVENVHYDLTEEDLRDLFTRIAPITELKLSYDRSGRSLGTAYVSYRHERSAREAISQFDGANANGQPIRLTIVPSAPATKRNPFDSVVRPARSLADRIDNPRNRGGSDRRSRSRSRSPGEDRRGNARRNQREDIDRYVPRDRSRSPRRGRGGGRGGTARGGRGDRRGGGRGGRSDADGRPTVQGRPRYTQEELDKDMDNYWGSKQDEGGAGASTTAPTETEGDVDMVE